MNPAFLMLAISLTTCLISLNFNDADFRRLWRTPKIITNLQVIEFSIFFIVFSMAALLTLAIKPAQLKRRRDLTEKQLRTLVQAESLFFRLTVVGYLAFAIQAVRKGLIPLILSSLASMDFSSGEVEENLTTIPGVSTLTQFGVAQVIVAGTLLSTRRLGQYRSRFIRHIVLVVLFAAFRAILLTERLAVLELVIPLLAALLSFAIQGSKQHSRARTAPFVLGPMVIVIFAASEYTRSWEWYRTHGTTNFGQFVIERLAGYYVTAYNNAGIRDIHATRASLPYDTWEFFWRAPLIENLNLFENLTGTRIQEYFDILASYGNPEFNNQSGVSGALIDYGFWGALVFFVSFAVVTANLYRAYREGRSIGIFLYPVFFLTLLEYPRYMWIAGGRAFPSMVALLILTGILSNKRAYDEFKSSRL